MKISRRKTAINKVMCLLLAVLFMLSLSGSSFLSGSADNPDEDVHGLPFDQELSYLEAEEADIVSFYDLPIIDESLWDDFNDTHFTYDLIMPLSAPTVSGFGSVTGPTSASLTGMINNPSSEQITFRGFWVRRSDLSEVREVPGNGGDVFSATIGDLTTGATYLVRAVIRTPGMVNSAIQSDPHFEIRPTPPPGGATPPPGGSTPTPPPGGSTPTPPPGGSTPTPPPTPTPTPAPSFSFNPSHLPPWNSTPWTPSAVETSVSTTVNATQSWSWNQSSGSEGWLTVTGSGTPNTQLTLRVQRNDTGVRREATVTVTSGSLPPRTLNISQAPVLATMRDQRVIECFGRRGYVDVHGATDTTILGGISGAIVERPVWNFVHIEANVFAIRNDTTGRYFTESGGNLTHAARISGSGTNYSNNQRWLISPQPNGTYRIRSISNTSLYVTDGMLVLTLSSQNTSNNSQLWRIGYIWHVANNPNYENWIGFWDGVINIRTATFDTSAEFDFFNRMATAREAWSRALGITFNPTTDVGLANIRAYGGHRDRIQNHLRREEPFCPDEMRFGVALPMGRIIDSHMGPIQAGGATRHVNRFNSGEGSWMIMAVFTDRGVENTTDPRNINFATMTAIHELGHALGYMGHSPNSNDVMTRTVGSSPNVILNPAEIEHLRQVYRRFR